MKKEILDCLTRYACCVAEPVQYTNWSDEFCRKELKNSTDIFLEEIRKHIDWNNLTKKEAEELGFRRWSNVDDLYLIPLYLLPIVPIGTELASISNKKVIYDGLNVDNDTRFGCIAFGLYLKD